MNVRKPNTAVAEAAFDGSVTVLVLDIESLGPDGEDTVEIPP